MTHLNVTALMVVIGTLIPFVTGVLAKEKNSNVKALVNAALAAVAGAATQAVATGGNVQLSQWVLSIAVAFGASVVSYHGLWNPTGAIDWVVVRAASLLAKVGIHLSPHAELTVEDWLKTIFGDAVEFLSAEEAKAKFGSTPSGPAVPGPESNGPYVVAGVGSPSVQPTPVLDVAVQATPAPDAAGTDVSAPVAPATPPAVAPVLPAV